MVHSTQSIYQYDKKEHIYELKINGQHLDSVRKYEHLVIRQHIKKGLEDAQYLWLTTDEGVWRITKEDGSRKQFTETKTCQI